jgi:hypothetical protein
VPLDVLLVPTVAPVLPWSEGSCAMVVKMLGWAFFAIAAALSTWVGVGAAKPVAVMREPVTTISLAAGCAGPAPAVGVAIDGAPAGAASCATAGDASASSASTLPVDSSARLNGAG